MSRPEHIAPPEIYYDEREALKYSNNSRIIKIQSQLSRRCIELLNLPNSGHRRHRRRDGGVPKLILDIGCGSGLSGSQLSRAGHHWVGVDISSAMLDVALQREVDGDLLLQDMGQGICFRPGSFDGAISVSALQWLCNADKTSHHPRKRLSRFFETLYASLAHGARAVFQMYPENPRQIEMITSCAMKSGFTGGLVIDYPHSTKAKKYFLCLFAGTSMEHTVLPHGKDGMVEDISDSDDDSDDDSSSMEEDMDEDAPTSEDNSHNDGSDTEESGSDIIMDDDDDDEDEDIPFKHQLKTVSYTTQTSSAQQQQRRQGPRETIKSRKAREKLEKQYGGIVKSKAWISHKKEKAKQQGKHVPRSSKYTGRKRRPRF